MTHFVEKHIVYYEYVSCNYFLVRIVKDPSDYTVAIFVNELNGLDVVFDEKGDICEFHSVNSPFILSLDSWHVFLSRHFPSVEFLKVRETYIYEK